MPRRGAFPQMFFVAILFIHTIKAQYGFRTFQETMVHIDMKGSAPRPTYLKQLFGTFSQLGATGVLLEWEDMFPFKGPIGDVVNGQAYSQEDVHDVLSYAQSLGLTVVPLVQSLGHAEWILKTEQFHDLREDPEYPMVFCVGNPASKFLIYDMIHQVAEVHNKYNMPFFHIGADEAYQIGVCPEDLHLLNTTYSNNTKRLTLHHMQGVAQSIMNKYPYSKVLAWYDEFKSADIKMVHEYNLSSLIEPVVWKYTDNLDNYLPPGMWRNLSQMFTHVWGASAFKGANGADQMDNAMLPYITNNRQWFLQALQHRDKFTEFRGVFLTGWSRYDHFATLCEMMPTSMASLAINIQLVQNFIMTEPAALTIMKALKCPGDTSMDSLMKNKDKCHYAGYRVRDIIREFRGLKMYYHNSTWIHNRERGWLRQQHQLGLQTNPYYVDVLRSTYSKMLTKMDAINARLRAAMDEIFFAETSIEFQITYIDEFYDDIGKKLDAIIKIDEQKSWKPRPVFGTTQRSTTKRTTTTKPPTTVTTTTTTPSTTTVMVEIVIEETSGEIEYRRKRKTV